MKRLVGGDFLLDMSPIELELSVDGTTKTNITDNEVLGQLTDLKRFIGSPSMVKPIWCKLTNGETDELIVARGTLAVVDVGEFEICIPLDGYKLTISVEFTQMETEDHAPLDDWYIDTNDAKYLLISDTQAIANIDELPVFENIVDKDGHKRFLEGDGTPLSQEGVEITYCKWSLSGTHLMFVVAGTVANETIIGDTANFATYELPEWVHDKIFPTWSNYIESKTVSARDTSWASQSITAVLKKQTSNLIQIGNVISLTMTSDKSFRIQFDLLIDNEETPAP